MVSTTREGTSALTWGRVAWVALSALLVALSFPNPLALSLHPWGAPLAWIALAPLFIAWRGLRPAATARCAWLFGFLMFSMVLYWVALLEAAEYLRFWGWLALSLVCSLYVALVGLAQGWVRPPEGRGGSALLASLWTAMEFFRGAWPFGGFTWGQIGFAHASSPALLAWTSLTGIWCLTFASVFVSAEAAAAHHLFHSGRRRESLARLAGAALLVATLYGVGSILQWRPSPGSKPLKVACLQPNLPQDEKWSPESETRTYDILESLTQTVAPLRPSLIVWPETASPNYLLWRPDALTRVARIVRRSGVAALVGCLDAEQVGETERHYNSANAFSPEGVPRGAYHKVHLVPFGEYVPFQRYLRFLGPVVGDLGSFDRGEGPRLFAVRDLTYTPLICYEAIFPRDARLAARTDADLLVNISNDAWYGRTAALYQHALLCAAQSAAVRRPMARAANTGISFLADASGKVVATTEWWRQEALVAEVPSATGTTLYRRWGDWFGWFCVLVGLGAIAFRAWKAKDRLG